ncbi:MAG: signal peptidase II [Bacteroidota bacterium]
MKAFYVTLTVVIADQLTKLFVKGIALPSLHIYYPGMQLGESVSILGSFLRLTFVENPGMAFGIEVQHRPLLVLFTAIAAAAITWYLYSIRHERFLNRLPFAMILGGAIGNLIDRIFYGVLFGEGPLLYGKVVDFIDMNFFKINLFGFHINRFAVYNIADASVSVGLVLMLLFHRAPERKKPEAEMDQTTEIPRIGATDTGLPLGGLKPDGMKSIGESDRGSIGTSIEG